MERGVAAGELARDTRAGGLVVVGSGVPKTTEQLDSLLAHRDRAQVEVSVDSVRDAATAPAAIAAAAKQVDDLLRAGQDTGLFTSRTLLTGSDAEASLRIGQRVSAAPGEIVSRLGTPPRFFIAKGGITSSDLATRALGVRRALVRARLCPESPSGDWGRKRDSPGWTTWFSPATSADQTPCWPPCKTSPG